MNERIVMILEDIKDMTLNAHIQRRETIIHPSRLAMDEDGTLSSLKTTSSKGKHKASDITRPHH